MPKGESMKQKKEGKKLRNSKGRGEEKKNLDVIERMKIYMEKNYSHTGDKNTKIKYFYKKR